MFDPDDDELFEEGFWNGHDVYRDTEGGGIWYDGYYCVDASVYEEAEMEYWIIDIVATRQGREFEQGEGQRSGSGWW